MTDAPRRALLQPRSLDSMQLGTQPVSRPAAPMPVQVWVLWEDGTEELLGADHQAVAVAWTPRAVRVRWGSPPRIHEVWVWAGAVTRREQT